MTRAVNPDIVAELRSLVGQAPDERLQNKHRNNVYLYLWSGQREIIFRVDKVTDHSVVVQASLKEGNSFGVQWQHRMVVDLAAVAAIEQIVSSDSA